MNRAEKEAYLRDYEVLKKQGKPFFPYAVMKDSTMALIVVLVIVVMSLVLGAEQGPKADPTTTTYTPRPEWYFFFLFEVLRVIKPPELVPLATIIIPTIAMVLLLLLPFYDRGAERQAGAAADRDDRAALTVVVMAYLTYAGANAGPPSTIDLKVPRQYEAGKLVVAQSGCLACHKIGDNGNGALGSEPDPGRRADPAQRDPALAEGGPGHHALVPEPRPEEAERGRRLPRIPQVAGRLCGPLT